MCWPSGAPNSRRRRRWSLKPIVIDGPLQTGDRVWVPSLQASGEVVAVGSHDVEVKIGGFRMKLGQSRVELQRARRAVGRTDASRAARSRGRPARAWSWTSAA